MVAESLFDLPLKRWSVEEYHRLIAAGILTSDDHVELLDGQIVEMVPQDPPHASNTSSFGNEFVLLFAGKAWIRTQLPLTIAPDSEPEPDIAVVRIDPNRYRDRHPTPEDVFLPIEIADPTLNQDRNRKAKIYAQAGILEYWVVNLKQQQVIVYRHPQGDSYQSEQILEATEAIAPLAFPEVRIELQTILL
ncbi:Uma2 family endonuclease [Leptolyngbya sp. NK1-12]|uniref:Uma2 family endonuclease n=1 Tax=Leptolyngbya sp. NK1-12 TaxID=2547451 RepID=A0AA97AG14_9CYAN|nr:Uma2 family endonuclease [Leptolyngbya sp. NK1-12]WNZ22949.1 Uma2 family endonuclease [Leptolyngbya sp. NK1-12]